MDEDSELARRLAVLEGILGTDVLDGCNGDPLSCEVGCTNDTCPLTSNPISRLRDEVALLRRENQLLRAVFDTLEKRGVVPPDIRDKARMKVELDDLTVNLHRARLTYREMGRAGMVGSIKGEVAERIREIQSEIDQIQSLLDVGLLDVAPGGQS